MNKKYMYYENRDLSWIKFNLRCLEEAEDPETPLFERLFFMSIWQTNLDEFFMVRVGGIHDRLLFNKNVTDNKSGMNELEQLTAIHESLEKKLKRVDLCYKNVFPLCRQYGISQINYNKIPASAYSYLEKYFEREIRPLLSPVITDDKSPFPFLENNALYLGALLHKKGESLLAIVPVSNVFDRLIFLPSKKRKFILAEDLIYAFAEKLFDQYEVEQKSVFRITRNADLDAEEALEDDLEKYSYRKSMEILLKKRKRLAPVRIEFYDNGCDHLEERLKKSLKLKKEQSYKRNMPLSLSFLSEIKQLLNPKENPHLFYPKIIPQQCPELDMLRPLIPQVQRKNILLSYPYQDFSIFIRLLAEAAIDPEVSSISITLYREADNSKIVDALVRAAENGKQVLALVELRARFDESHNIEVSRQLESSGVEILYGLEDFKVHSKLLLITRGHGEEISYITQIGTGNYNESTARLYSDLTYITADPAFGHNAMQVFSALRNRRPVKKSPLLLVSPLCLKPKVLKLIEEQAALARSGKKGRLIFKLNSLTDIDIINALIAASQAGVKIDLIIRGICCLKTGYKATENITVRSIIGRFLEHSRIYMFGQEQHRKMYISSADFMTRNTQRRVEIAAPILDEEARAYIEYYIHTQLEDNVKTRIQTKGNYKKIIAAPEEKRLNSQHELIREAYKKAGKEAPERIL